MIMKRIFRILVSLGCAIPFITSCHLDDPILEYKDASEIDTEEAVYSVVQNDLLSPSFRLVELAEVFSGYQKIRSDREAALDYVYEYFDTRNYVYYEYMTIDRWGTVSLEFDGSYKAEPSYWKYFWIACNMHREVHITMPEEHIYIATGLADDAIYEFNASVENSTITMTELHAHYETDLFGTPRHKADIKILEPLEMPMCKNGKGKLEPVSGKIEIDYISRYAKRTFQVEFHQTNKTIILPDGSTRDADPEPTPGRNEY